MWVTLAFACWVSAQQQVSPGQAIVHAMLHHDHSIESMEWSQRTLERRLTPDGTWSEWELYIDGRFGEDSKGNWYHWGRIGVVPSQLPQYSLKLVDIRVRPWRR